MSSFYTTAPEPSPEPSPKPATATAQPELDAEPRAPATTLEQEQGVLATGLPGKSQANGSKYQTYADDF